MSSQWPDIWTGKRIWQQDKSVRTVAMILKLYEFHSAYHWFPLNAFKLGHTWEFTPYNTKQDVPIWKCLLLLWPWQRSIWSGWCLLGSSSIDVSTCRLKIFQTQRWQFVPLLKVSNVKTFNDRRELEKKVKFNPMTCNKRSCHYAS